MTLLTFLCPASIWAGQKPAALAVRLKNVKVDGDLSDWAGAVPIVLGASNLSLPESEWDGPADLSAAGYVGWDERAVYLGALVFDDRVSCRDARSRDFKDSDYVRFYFDLDGDAEKRGGRLFDDDICVVLTPTGPRGRPMVKFPRYGGDPFRRPLSPLALTVASKTFDGGYTIEARVPADALDIAPREGFSCGFQFIVGDTDDSEREAEMAWSTGANYWFDPRAFGRLAFSLPASVERALEVEPRALTVSVSPRLLLLGSRVDARVLSLLPGVSLEGRLLLRRPGEEAVSMKTVKVPFGRFVEFPLDARRLEEGRFVVEFESKGFVKSARGVCLRRLWREALSLAMGAKTPLERLLAGAALEALKGGDPDAARRALERLRGLRR